jgi:Cytochrome bd terminal oxidase subunit I
MRPGCCAVGAIATTTWASSSRSRSGPSPHLFRLAFATVVQGLDSVPPDQRPTVRQTNIVHLCWDIMVGLGTLLFLLSVWYAVLWIFRRGMPQTKWFLRRRCLVSGGDHPGGRLGGDRGRPAAVDRL